MGERKLGQDGVILRSVINDNPTRLKTPGPDFLPDQDSNGFLILDPAAGNPESFRNVPPGRFNRPMTEHLGVLPGSSIEAKCHLVMARCPSQIRGGQDHLQARGTVLTNLPGQASSDRVVVIDESVV
jgi:hypothetical protein